MIFRGSEYFDPLQSKNVNRLKFSGKDIKTCQKIPFLFEKRNTLWNVYQKWNQM